jgi:hypothetical protein
MALIKLFSRTSTWLVIITLLITNSIYGQEESDSAKKKLKNTIRINITNPMLFGDKYNVIGYERVISKHQTFSFNIGRFALPKWKNFDTDSLALKDNYTDKGFTFAADYRFYLRKENRYGAPRGVYIGPYYSFNMFERTNSWTLNTADFSGDLQTRIRLNANLIGAQLGYQFIIKNRITLDMIMFGPGTWFYSVKTTTTTSLSEEDQALLFEKINGYLDEKLPGNDLFFQPGSVNKSGTYRTSSGGMRYLFQIGFRF